MNKKVVKGNSNKHVKATKRADKQRGAGMVELLFVASTLGTAVLIGAMSTPKLPPMTGD